MLCGRRQRQVNLSSALIDIVSHRLAYTRLSQRRNVLMSKSPKNQFLRFLLLLDDMKEEVSIDHVIY